MNNREHPRQFGPGAFLTLFLGRVIDGIGATAAIEMAAFAAAGALAGLVYWTIAGRWRASATTRS